MTTTRRLSARQLATKLSVMDAQLARLDAIIGDFHSIAALADGPVSDEIGSAFNAASDARDALQRERDEVAANRGPSKVDPITASLISQNID